MGKIPSSAATKTSTAIPGPTTARIVPEPQGGTAVLWIGRLLLTGAIGISIYLVYAALQASGVAGCEEGADCSAVLGSKWAKVLGVPVGVFGIGLYAALLLATLGRQAGKASSFLVLAIIGGALWFTGIQAFVLKAFCPWCCATHALATVGALMVWQARRVAGLPLFPILPLSGVVASLGAVAVLQFHSPETGASPTAGTTAQAAVTATPKGRESVQVHEKYRILLSENPALGDPVKAGFVAVGLFDFSCDHCRHTQKLLKPILEAFEGRLAIVKLPGYFDDNGRNIHRMMLSLFKANRPLYDEISAQLYSEILTAKAPAVQEQIEKRMGKLEFSRILILHSPWAEARLKETKEISNINKSITGNGRLPQLIAGKTVETGSNDNPSHYYKLFADNFGLTLGDAPVLAYEPASIDFGEVIAMGEASAALTLTNLGKRPIVFGPMQRPKGVIVTDAPEQLAPGESRKVTVRLQVPQIPDGRGDSFFVIRSNAMEAEMKVPLLAAVRNPFTLEPAALDFGNIQPGSTSPVTILKLRMDIPAKIGDVTASLPDFIITNTEIADGGKIILISLKAVPSVSNGYRSGFLNIPLEPITAPTGAATWPKQLRVPLRVRAFVTTPQPVPAAVPAAMPKSIGDF